MKTFIDVYKPPLSKFRCFDLLDRILWNLSLKINVLSVSKATCYNFINFSINLLFVY